MTKYYKVKILVEMTQINPHLVNLLDDAPTIISTEEESFCLVKNNSNFELEEITKEEYEFFSNSGKIEDEQMLIYVQKSDNYFSDVPKETKPIFFRNEVYYKIANGDINYFSVNSSTAMYLFPFKLEDLCQGGTN